MSAGADVSKGCRGFIELFRELFRLESDFAYDEPLVSKRAHECTAIFHKGERSVFMIVDYVEFYGALTIEIRPPDATDRFCLHEAIEVMDATYHAARPKHRGHQLTAEQLRVWLEFYAEFLHRHSEQLLGDSRKVAEKVRQLRRVGSGPVSN